MRKAARTEGRRYCDAVVLTYQAERMPEPIRLKVGGVTQPQMAVYEEFARNIPGFLPITDQDTMFLTKPVPISSVSFSFIFIFIETYIFCSHINPCDLDSDSITSGKNCA